ncbi:uncharacterized protein At5g08430 isoform X4 [Cucumis sativus]|uniref:uncharacterized protein At5g08430 isoform X4 n=1 Tax=Cucumis sativus TaxID=3659 RepID=UPI0002B4B4AE|nr:uncharacterized protein At5g08430 isoform X4 [Cucumis sativus]KAE8646125.1 hypothetical protein Csa_016053 [Cucumis sativus]
MDSFEWIESSGQQVCTPVRMKRKIRSKRYEFVGWGSRPLIEFLESVGKDIKEKISRHDVTSIINEYVNINNLLHPSKKKRILCDDRLHSIFGRKTIGRIKIHDMLEPHFAENQHESDDDFSYSSDETENLFSVLKRDNGITPGRKLSQKTRVHVNPNSSFAAVVPGNINLVYLRKSLVEDLLKDHETFESKLIGSFVRIKSDPHDYLQKNTHQLVQVIGLKKISISGDLGPGFLLHVSNVMKDVSISMLSDENFSEEECKDLDLRIKNGLVKRLTIAEVQRKVEVLHVDITKHWLSREISLLQNLIDQANEKGWRKELDQYLEKKQLLQSAAEQSRILREIPQVIADETEFGGIHASADQADNVTKEGDETKLLDIREASDDRKQGETVFSSNSNVDTYGAENPTTALMFNLNENTESRQIFLDEQAAQPVECTYNYFIESEPINAVDKGCQANEQIKESTVIDLSDDDEPPRAEEHDWNNKLKSLIWYYLDPQGDVQGPFCLASLKNWKDANYFPSDFKVWRTGQTQDQAVLLNDILSPFFS